MDGTHSRRSLAAGRNGNKERSCNLNQDEEDLVIRLHKLLGDRWALIAGRIPGRTPEEIERYWKLTKRSVSSDKKNEQF